MLKKNKLGQTDIEVSTLGLGTVKFGRNQQVHFPEAFSLPTDKAIQELLSIAQQAGINLLDTAPAYGSSEERLGNLLAGQRHHWIISTKVGEEFVDGQSHFNYTENNVRQSIERSLKRLKTDYLDIVLVHSNGEDKKIIEDTGVFNVLTHLKTQGFIRAFGMSTKTVAGGLLTIQHADVVMVTYHPAYIDEQAVITKAYQSNKGVFIKKALASGHLQKIALQEPVHASFNFILQEPGISSIIVGTLNKEHLLHNINCVERIHA